jgi:hypothetical protein
MRRLLMRKRRSVRVTSEPKRRGWSRVGNPLWPLEDLRNLRSPPFVADPEFTPFTIDAFGREPKGALASASDPTRIRPSQRQRLCTGQRQIQIPRLVAGIPWRFAPQIGNPIVPETEFTPLDLSHISRQ